MGILSDSKFVSTRVLHHHLHVITLNCLRSLQWDKEGRQKRDRQSQHRHPMASSVNTRCSFIGVGPAHFVHTSYPIPDARNGTESAEIRRG